MYYILYYIYTLYYTIYYITAAPEGTFIVICYMSYMTFMRLFLLIMDGYPC